MSKVSYKNPGSLYIYVYISGDISVTSGKTSYSKIDNNNPGNLYFSPDPFPKNDKNASEVFISAQADAFSSGNML